MSGQQTAQAVRRWLLEVSPPVAGALACGSLGALGRPGIDLLPFYFGALWWLSYVCLRAPRLQRALLLAGAWGVGMGAGVGIGAWSWGPIVPLGIALTIVLSLALPHALLARFATSRAHGALAFVIVASTWTLWMTLIDMAGIPARAEATALLGVHPDLVLGARIVGGNLLSGVALGGVVSSAAAWISAPGTPFGYRVRRALQPIAVALTLLMALSALARWSAPSPTGRLQVGVPQIDADATYYQSRIEFPAIERALEMRVAEQLRALTAADLIVFTETYDGRYGLMLEREREALAARAKHRGQALLVTSYLVEADGRKSNAVGGFAADGTFLGIRRKVLLAPYGERSLAPGVSHEPLDVAAGLRVGVVICNEAIQSSAVQTMARQGANLLAATTSDITFGSSVLAFEHLAAVRLEAIEAGRDMVWASNGGPSAVLTRFGRVQARTPFRAPAVMLGTAELYDDLTPYLRSQLVFAVLSALLLAAGVWVNARRPAQQGLDQAAEPSTRGLGRSLLALAGVCLAVLLGGGQAAFVEWRHGEPSRARAAIADLFSRKPSLVESSASSRFVTGPQASGVGAAALLGAYYGAAPLGERPSVSPASLPELQAYLESHFGLRTSAISIESGEVPRVAAIAELRAGGFAVTTRADGDEIHLFRTGSGQQSRLDVNDLRKTTTGRLLLPVGPTANDGS